MIGGLSIHESNTAKLQGEERLFLSKKGFLLCKKSEPCANGNINVKTAGKWSILMLSMSKLSLTCELLAEGKAAHGMPT